VDLGYTHIFVKDADVDLSTDDPENTLRGNLSGTYEAKIDKIDIIALQGSLRF
jgi:hypothetical protein